MESGLNPETPRCPLQVQLQKQMERSAKEFAELRRTREREVQALRRQVLAHPRIFHSRAGLSMNPVPCLQILG